MQVEELVEEIPITEEDLLSAYHMLDGLARRGELARLLEAHLELVVAEAELAVRELVEIGSKLLPRVSELDLEAMAGTLLGALDPIGQLRAWLADQLKSLASWFASIAQGVVSNLWHTLIKPALDTLRYLIDSVRVGVAAAIDSATRAITSAVSGLRDYLASTLASLASSITSLAQSIAGGVRALIDALPRIVDAVRSAVGSAADAIVRSVSGIVSGLGFQLILS